MAAYSYQPHHFLLSSTFLPNTTPFDISGFVSEGNFTNYKNSTTIAAFANNMTAASESFLPMNEGFSDAGAYYQYHQSSSCCHDQSSKMHSAASSIDIEKVEEIDHEQVLINCTSDKEKKARKGPASLSSTQSKRRKLQVKAAKKEKKGQNVEEKKKPKANKKNPKECSEDHTQKEDYIHVRARRGQATDSHSLAERVRRERISERMKMLQALVPGCEKVTGKALMLDEIINYVQSLQNQIEFLSMKLASFNPIYSNFAIELDVAILKQERLSTLAASQPSGSSQLCSPTAVNNYNSSTTTFTTPTVGFYPALIESSLLLQQETAETLAWEQMDSQTQNFMNQSGLGNDMCSSFQ